MSTYNGTNYDEQGGGVTNVGGELNVLSGGIFDIQSGGVVKVDSTTVELGNVVAATTTSAADSLAIPVTAAYVAKTTGADAEALTLADGRTGQILTISLVAAGGGSGIGTLTPTTATGWATIVFALAGDSATLMYVNDTIGWVILALYGLAAQPAFTLPA